MLVNHYTLLGEAARAVKFEDYTPINKIEVGLTSKRVTPEVRQALKEWKYEKVDGHWEQVYMNVPIIFREIKRNYKFLENPDTRFYDVDEYKIPNPFESYWKARFLVQ